MNNFFIYQYNYKEAIVNGGVEDVSSTVIFCEADEISMSTLQTEISEFYESHNQTKKIFVFGGDYLRTIMFTAFVTNQDDAFRTVPKNDLDPEHIHLYCFNEIGVPVCINGEGVNPSIFPDMFNYGLTYIFIKRGGLIESKDAHHFVFPSGKHCDKFLRTGNILLYSSEIYFIAFRLLSSFKSDEVKQIYCDTSAINSLAFALQDLKRRIFQKNGKTYRMLPVESFSSYEGLYKGEAIQIPNSLILISASTSARIMDRIRKAHPMVRKDSMRILFFLGSEENYRENEAQIICNLTKSDSRCNGVDLYRTFIGSDCALCDMGSFPVKINGDIFLSESPKIKRVTLSKDDVPKFLNPFISQFWSLRMNEFNVIKANYKETSRPNLNYEIYIDINSVLLNISEGRKRYNKFTEKLDDFINQYIPSTTKYLICLPDEGSKTLAKYIISKVGHRYSANLVPLILSQDEIDQIPHDEIGAAVIIASCIANGKNLLYLSRSLRKRDKLKIIYFIGLVRMSNKEALEFLKSNLKQGIYGGETNSFYAVESIYCNNDVLKTSWANEVKFLKVFREFGEDEECSDALLTTIDLRIGLLEASMSNERKGLANALFYPSFYDNSNLELRKNYAFLNSNSYFGNLSQADVYFTISVVFNKLRNEKGEKKHLHQTEYLRCLIDPGNFTRYNDGIIQASILRAANGQELSYRIDNEASSEMRGILETIIVYQNAEQGEGLIEFLYAIAIRKMSLMDSHLANICDLILEKVTDPLACLFSSFIKKRILPEHYKYMSLSGENDRLRSEISALQHADRRE